MQSSSYVTKRQSIKLLGEILLDRANYQVMTAYVDRGEHLKLCMNLLKDERRMVQYEGFHVFKVRLQLLLSTVSRWQQCSIRDGDVDVIGGWTGLRCESA